MEFTMKRFCSLLLVLIASPLFSYTIYEFTKEIPADMQGYFSNWEPLEKVFAQKEIKTVIELGCWSGVSTIYFAEKVGPDGVVLAVDSWQGDSDDSHHVYYSTNHRFSYIYHLFLSNVLHSGYADRIVPIRMLTDEAAKAITVSADLIYVDAGHSTENVIRDILNWYPFLNEGGIMCGDDWSYWPSVQAGVIKAAKHLGKRIHSEGNFWYLY